MNLIKKLGLLLFVITACCCYVPVAKAMKPEKKENLAEMEENKKKLEERKKELVKKLDDAKENLGVALDDETANFLAKEVKAFEFEIKKIETDIRDINEEIEKRRTQKPESEPVPQRDPSPIQGKIGDKAWCEDGMQLVNLFKNIESKYSSFFVEKFDFEFAEKDNKLYEKLSGLQGEIKILRGVIEKLNSNFPKLKFLIHSLVSIDDSEYGSPGLIREWIKRYLVLESKTVDPKMIVELKKLAQEIKAIEEQCATVKPELATPITKKTGEKPLPEGKKKDEEGRPLWLDKDNKRPYDSSSQTIKNIGAVKARAVGFVDTSGSEFAGPEYDFFRDVLVFDNNKTMKGDEDLFSKKGCDPRRFNDVLLLKEGDFKKSKFLYDGVPFNVVDWELRFHGSRLLQGVQDFRTLIFEFMNIKEGLGIKNKEYVKGFLDLIKSLGERFEKQAELGLSSFSVVGKPPKSRSELGMGEEKYKEYLRYGGAFSELSKNEIEGLQNEVIEACAHRYKIHLQIKEEYLLAFLKDFLEFISADNEKGKNPGELINGKNPGKLIGQLKVQKTFIGKVIPGEGKQLEHAPLAVIAVYVPLIPGTTSERNAILAKLLNAILDRYKHVSKEITLVDKDGQPIKPRFNMQIKDFLYLSQDNGDAKRLYKEDLIENKNGLLPKGLLPGNTIYTPGYEFLKGHEFDISLIKKELR